MRYVRFTRNRGDYWKITFLPSGIRGVRKLISTFPDWMQQAQTGKTVDRFEPQEVIYLTREQKTNKHLEILKKRREEKKTGLVIVDILNYLVVIPILGDILIQVYLHRGKIKKFFDHMPKDKDSIKMVPYIIAGSILFYLFWYTFTFWATLFCLLLMGYAIRRFARSVKVKIIL